jgi:hypothetical protein
MIELDWGSHFSRIQLICDSFLLFSDGLFGVLEGSYAHHYPTNINIVAFFVNLPISFSSACMIMGLSVLFLVGWVFVLQLYIAHNFKNWQVSWCVVFETASFHLVGLQCPAIL